MFRKTRIRSLVAISALTGATVLGGAGLAGATGSDTDTDTIEPTSVVDAQSVLAGDDELSTGEPEAPTLPDHAAQQAHDALAERFAGGESEDESAETGQETTGETGATDEGDPAEEQGTHGERVSAVASSGSGEGHGEDVSEVARQQGEERRQAAQENRPERGGEGDTVEDENRDDDLEQ